MSWNPFSDDGKRMIVRSGAGYALYQSVGATRFQWCGWVPEWRYAEQWLADGEVRGEILDVPDAPKLKVKSGTAA